MKKVITIIILLVTLLNLNIDVFAENENPTNLAEYNPDTWEEWSKTWCYADIGGMQIIIFNEDDEPRPYLEVPSEAGKKYGLLINITFNNSIGYFDLYPNTINGNVTAHIATPGVSGLKKFIINCPTSNSILKFYTAETLGNLDKMIKFKDVRLFELPTGSQIESDFINMSPFTLNEKYPYNGNNIIVGDYLLKQIVVQVYIIGGFIMILIILNILKKRSHV